MVCYEQRAHLQGDMDSVIPRMEVEFCEKISTIELIQEFLGNRNQKLILDSHGIEGTVVSAETPCPVLLLDM